MKENLDYMLSGLALKSQGIEQVLYLDTSDLHAATLGMYAFYPLEDEKRHLKTFFAPDKTLHADSLLIQCLIARGDLGDFGLLPPHQIEYLRLLENRFRLSQHQEIHSLEFAREFTKVIAQELGHKPVAGKDGAAQEFPELTEEALRSITVNVPNYFKVVQCIMGTWRTRLFKWQQDNLLRIDSEDASRMLTVLNDPLYYQLHEAFSRRREMDHSSKNNIVDAMALTILAQKVSLLQEALDNNRELVQGAPVMYCHLEHLFRRIIKDAKVEHRFRFTITSKEGKAEKSVEVMRDESFFAFSVTLRKLENNPFIPQNFDKVLRLRNDVIKLLASPSTEIEEREIRNIADFEGRPLPLLLQNLREISFLVEVWYPFASSQDVQQAVRALKEASVSDAISQLNSTPVRDSINRLQEKLTEEAHVWRLGLDLWQRLLDAPQNLRSRLPVAVLKQPNLISPMRDYNLWLYGLSPIYFDVIDKFLIDFVFGVERDRDTRRRYIISAYITVLEVPVGASPLDRQRWNQDLAVVSGVLCACELWSELKTLFASLNKQGSARLPHFSFEVMYADALLKLYSRNTNRQRIVGDVNRTLEHVLSAYHEAQPNERPSVALAMSHLYFKRWQLKETALPDSGAYHDITAAIRYARDARKSPSQAFSLFACHYLLYYQLKSRDASLAHDIEQNFHTLRKARENEPQNWQPFYDHILAHYYYWKAQQLSLDLDLYEDERVERRQIAMKKALMHSELSCNALPNNSHISAFKAVLRREYTE